MPILPEIEKIRGTAGYYLGALKPLYYSLSPRLNRHDDLKSGELRLDNILQHMIYVNIDQGQAIDDFQPRLR
jgi:hypothetical protein